MFGFGFTFQNNVLFLGKMIEERKRSVLILSLYIEVIISHYQNMIQLMKVKDENLSKMTGKSS